MEVNAYILAGGKSSRFGSDKASFLINGYPMIDHVSEALQIPEIKSVSIVDKFTSSESKTDHIIMDVLPDKGPLGGILTALTHSKTELNFIVSCDLPFISKEIVRSFLAQIAPDHNTIISSGDRLHPLFGVYQKKYLALIEDFIANDRLKMMDFIDETGTVILKSEDLDGYQEKSLINVNTKEELERWITK